MRNKKKNTHVVSGAMHYAVFVALVISLITTCLLGMLLTQVLLGEGLNGLDEARLQRAKAATRRIIGLDDGGGSSMVPTAPNNLNANQDGMFSIRTFWVDTSSNESGFSVYRSTTTAGPWILTSTTMPNVAQFKDVGLSASTTYYYMVSAFNNTGNSGYSNMAGATTSSHSVCGNEIVELPEVCDGSNLNGETCQGLGHGGGTLTCSRGCGALIVSGCTSCGNFVVDINAGEVCDPSANPTGCAVGSNCNASCTACVNTCGNGSLEPVEVCDATAVLTGCTATSTCNSACTACR